MIAVVESATVLGLEAFKVDVEVNISLGLPSFTIVGLPDTSIQESRERVRAAIINSEFDFPLRRLTVNLAPADVKKEGPAFDLPIALSLLIAAEQLKSPLISDYWVIGELSLTGETRKVNGCLSIALAAKKMGKKGLIVPQENGREAAIVKGIEVIPVKTFLEVVEFLDGRKKITPLKGNLPKILSHRESYDVDFSEVKGQHQAKRALEIAAAGGHNVLMIGPPGSGKTMLARRLPTILPDLTLEEAIEITKVYSVAGFLPSGNSLLAQRPFRAPHHTISNAGLAGGGTYPRPGEISLSHRGVLFLDEFPEFSKNVLQVLRQPLEDGNVTLSRAATSLTYPAQFTLVAAMNPCPCGWFGDRYKECLCSPSKIQAYRSKISGPLLDRIDIQVEVPRLTRDELVAEAKEESSLAVKERIQNARKLQEARFKGQRINCNAEMKPRHIRKYCSFSTEVKEFLGQAIEKLGFSGRVYDRVLKLARTIADLAAREEIVISDIAEAIQYRSLDRPQFF